IKLAAKHVSTLVAHISYHRCQPRCERRSRCGIHATRRALKAAIGFRTYVDNKLDCSKSQRDVERSEKLSRETMFEVRDRLWEESIGSNAVLSRNRTWNLRVESSLLLYGPPPRHSAPTKGVSSETGTPPSFRLDRRTRKTCRMGLLPVEYPLRTITKTNWEREQGVKGYDRIPSSNRNIPIAVVGQLHIHDKCSIQLVRVHMKGTNQETGILPDAKG
ncbi:MAG: hypothetical protein Q9224_005118, partial [Gallowayella concinna]